MSMCIRGIDIKRRIVDEAKQNVYTDMHFFIAPSIFSNVYILKELKCPKIIWICMHSLNPSNHIMSHRGVHKMI